MKLMEKDKFQFFLPPLASSYLNNFDIFQRYT